MRHAEAKSKIEFLTTKNKKMKREDLFCKDEVNNMTKLVENFENLQKIASSALETANKEKGELKAQMDELTLKVARLSQ